MIAFRGSQALEKVLVFFKNNLDKGVWKDGERLPSSRSLAARLGVSKSTVGRAVATLKSSALVSGLPKGYLRAGPEPASIQTNAAETGQWILKRQAFEKDILSGVYAAHNLPSLKEMQGRYGACFRTMRKILQSMEADGVVGLYGKKYALKTVARRGYQDRVVFITYRVEGHPWSALNTGEYRVLDALEHACLRQELKLDIVEMNFFNPTVAGRVASSPAVANPALGYLVDLWWAEPQEYRRSCLDLLARLATLKLPVSILDEQGDFDLPLPFAANPLFQVFRIEGKKAGTRVARHLLDYGHRSIAFLSPFHNLAYSQQRLAGVVEHCTRAGLPRQVPLVMNNAMENFLLQILQLAQFNKNVVQKIIAVNRTPREAKDLYEAYCRFKKKRTHKQFRPAEVHALRENLASVADLACRNMAGDYFDKMCIAALKAAEYQLFDMSVEPLFEQALALKNATAWICVSDGTAITALRYLRKKGISVPEKLSIIGFDNLPVEALEKRLTSFDFNVWGFVNRMLAFITRPPQPRGPYRHSAIEVEGTVMVRGSTGKPYGNPTVRTSPPLRNQRLV